MDQLRQPWVNLAARLQALASSQRGYAIITVRIVVDPNCAPIWIEPKMVKIEPVKGSHDWLNQLFAYLSN